MSGEKRLNRAGLRAYIDETTFRLRPKDYKEKYPKWNGSVGLEIEMLPVAPDRPENGVPGRVKLQGAGETSAAILRQLAQANGWATEDTEDDHGEQLLLRVEVTKEGDNVSFEPGGQVEFSSAPYPCLAEAVRRTRQMQKILDDAFAAHGFRFVQVGINPWHTVPELGLQMRKGRYRAMDRHFASIGAYGQRMMRQTCTVQVNLDFGPDEATLAKRYLAAMLLSPVAAATFSNSPIVDRKYVGVPGFRTRVWRHADPSRTGVPGLQRVASALSREACIETYLDFALGARVVFVTGLDYRSPPKPMSFADWLETPIDGVYPTLDDFKVHMSLLFPEVRARGFLELRSIDCQARGFEAVPAAYMTGLLYDDRTLDQLLGLLMPHRHETEALLVRAEQGLHDPTIGPLAKQVMALACEGFSAQPPCFKADGAETELLAFREHFTDRGETPGDDVVRRMRSENQPYLSLQALQAVEDSWASLIK